MCAHYHPMIPTRGQSPRPCEGESGICNTAFEPFFNDVLIEQHPPQPPSDMEIEDLQYHGNPWDYHPVALLPPVIGSPGWNGVGGESINGVFEHTALTAQGSCEATTTDTPYPPSNSSQQSTTGTECTNTNKKLVCPYYKRYPSQFKRARPCSGPGFSGIHRLKEHLRRTHGRPAHTCRRCLRNCKTAAGLSEHLRATEACVVIPDQHINGKMTAAQQAELQSKRRMSSDATDEDKWNVIFRILFPGVSPASIPSPYFEDDEIIVGYDNSCSPHQIAFEDILKATPNPALMNKVKVDIQEVIFSTGDSHTKVEKLYDIVRGFPILLLNQDQSSRVEGT
ncbi:hypothetical protein F5Y04DRAFT_188269 [Hypomontagnella monticulosa]|nr:hypothetical protein F5Y04DRAFT_188269 [Hypomontagnella monticulosa]